MGDMGKIEAMGLTSTGGGGSGSLNLSDIINANGKVLADNVNGNGSSEKDNNSDKENAVANSFFSQLQNSANMNNNNGQNENGQNNDADKNSEDNNSAVSQSVSATLSSLGINLQAL